MKVYELMKVLGDMTAGAEVKVNQLLTVGEVTKSEIADVDNGVDIHSLTKNIAEAEEDGEGNVYLYTD